MGVMGWDPHRHDNRWDGMPPFPTSRLCAGCILGGFGRQPVYTPPIKSLHLIILLLVGTDTFSMMAMCQFTDSSLYHKWMDNVKPE